MPATDLDRLEHMRIYARKAMLLGRGLTQSELSGDERTAPAIIKCLEIVGKRQQQVMAESRQQVAASRGHLLERRQDAAAATTTFATRQTPLNVTVGPPRNQWLTFAAKLADGDKAAEAPRVIATIETRFSGGVYRNAGQVVLTADGQAVPLRVISYDANPRRAGGATRATTRQDDETLEFELTLPQLKTIAAAKQVTRQAGYVKFSLTPEQLQSLRILHEELSGGVNGRG